MVRLQGLVILCGIAFFGVVAAKKQSTVTEYVTAHSFRVVDKAGKIVSNLTATDRGGVLFLNSSASEGSNVSLGVTHDQATMVMYGPANKASVQLSAQKQVAMAAATTSDNDLPSWSAAAMPDHHGAEVLTDKDGKISCTEPPIDR